MKTGSASSSVDDLFKSLAGRRLESLCKGKKKCVQQLEIYGRATVSIQIQMELIAIMSRVRFSKQLERAILDARVGTQSSAECSDTKKEQDFISYKGLAFGNNLSPSRIGTRRKPLCLSTRARYHLSQSFPIFPKRR